MLERLGRGLPTAIKAHRRSSWAQRLWLEWAAPGVGLEPGGLEWEDRTAGAQAGEGLVGQARGVGTSAQWPGIPLIGLPAALQRKDLRTKNTRKPLGSSTPQAREVPELGTQAWV